MMISKRKFLQNASLGVLLFVAQSSSKAFLHRSSGVTGKTQLGGFDITGVGGVGAAFPFMNFFKTWTTSLSTNSPTILNTNGFPETASLPANIGGLIPIPANWSGQALVLKWTGTLALALQFGTLVTVGGGFVTAGGAGGNTGTNLSGTNGRIVFTITQSPFPSQPNFFFIAGNAQQSLTSMVLCLASNEAAIDAGGIFNPDFLSVVRALNPGILRQMGWTLSAGQEVLINPQYNYQIPIASMSYTNIRFPPTIWAGAISNSGNVYSCGSYTDMPVSWTDKEVFQGSINNANTVLTITGAANNGSGLIRLAMASTASLSTNQIVSFGGYNPNGSGIGVALGAWKITVIDGTHIDLASSYPSGIASSFVTAFSSNGSLSTATINVGGRGAKLLSAVGAIPLAAGGLATGKASFVYDATLDQVVYGVGGLYCGMPLTIQIALCNAVNAHLWYTFPSLISDASVISMTQLVAATLGGAQNFYAEYSNETWNGNFTQYYYCWQMGAALGLSAAALGTVQQNLSFSGLRTRQIMGNIKATWTGAQSRLKRVMACQAFGDTTNFNTYKFQGHDLAAFGDGASYNTFPNRPIDYCDVVSYAPYAQGAQLNTTYPADASGAADYSNMTTAADLYATGTGPNIASALAMVDADYRSTSTFPADVGNLFAYAHTTGGGGNNIYYGWETITAGYDGAGRPSGLPNLTGECYEGSFQFLGPTTSQCTGLNISTTYSAKVATLITAYQNSPLAAQLMIDYVKQFLGTDPTAATFGLLPHSKTMAFLELTGANIWGLLPTDIYSTPFQTYVGVQSVNH